jgi:3-hydroxyacyl-[acyl-carrier protein] dehydratase/trans-2-decenoyl-[acyl-carrier protein] isomerase
MKYAEYVERTSFTKEELVAISHSKLVDDPPCGEFGLLPAPPFLMFDRVTEIRHDGARGAIVAEKDVGFDDWYFQCHFRNDPVQPGCLGVDAIWQLLGLYCSVRGAPGIGRALGCKEVEFSGQIRPFNRLVRYEIDVRRYSALSKTVLVIGDGRVVVDGEPVYRVADAKVGLFEQIAYPDYPNRSRHSVGGVMRHAG